jgi:DNA-binding LacI/PurR family transcriptional regulator
LSKKKRAGLHDVAKLAGVSHTTVSRVLNEQQYVSEKTKSKVEKAMLQLDYRPNLHARSLVTRSSTTVGILIISDANLVGSLKILSEVSVEATKANFLTSITTYDRNADESLRHAMFRLLDQGLAGIVVISARKEGLNELVEWANGLPLVFCKAGPDNFGYRIKLENEIAAYRATHQLISLGHKKIVHFSGPKGLIDSDDRREGFERAMREAGLVPDMVYEGDWSADSGYKLGKDLIASGKKFTAVFSGNDKMALGLIHALNQKRLEVPRDVSIVGFDDLEESKHYRPALTTVRQDFSEFGSRAIAMLQAQISGGGKPNFEELNPELVLRNSCDVVLNK